MRTLDLCIVLMTMGYKPEATPEPVVSGSLNLASF
jgi:hypothetical protein